MKAVLSLLKRNLLKYFRDKTTVFFSFLSVLITLGLYVFFLGDMQQQNIVQVFDEAGFTVSAKTAKAFINSWLVAGLIAVNTINIPLAILSFKVEDRETGVDGDFSATPAKRWQILFGYVLASWVIGFATSVFVLILGQIFIAAGGGGYMGTAEIIQSLGVGLFAVIMYSGLFFMIVMFLKKQSQSGALATFVGTLSGFLGGIYVPLGVLGKGFSATLLVLPFSQPAVILRKIIMKNYIEKLLANTPEPMQTGLLEGYGVNVGIGGAELQNWHLLLIMTAYTVLFYGLALLFYSKFKKKSD